MDRQRLAEAIVARRSGWLPVPTKGRLRAMTLTEFLAGPLPPKGKLLVIDIQEVQHVEPATDPATATDHHAIDASGES